MRAQFFRLIKGMGSSPGIEPNPKKDPDLVIVYFISVL